MSILQDSPFPHGEKADVTPSQNMSTMPRLQVAMRQTPQARSGPSESDYLTWEGLSYKQK